MTDSRLRGLELDLGAAGGVRDRNARSSRLRRARAAGLVRARDARNAHAHDRLLRLGRHRARRRRHRELHGAGNLALVHGVELGPSAPDRGRQIADAAG